jgi:hypothetical protein
MSDELGRRVGTPDEVGRPDVPDSAGTPENAGGDARPSVELW